MVYDKHNPYISIVVAARNDDHGGDMLKRMQLFVTNLLKQAEKFQIPLELLIVEWNPPRNSSALVSVLHWPKNNIFVSVRIITVPQRLHRTFRYSEKLPFFQMIAKNVGIRRAKGVFILATNIDILFSDELMHFLAQRQLSEDLLYRIDRYDVSSDVSGKIKNDQILQYCRTHIIRVNKQSGTFTLEEMKWGNFILLVRRLNFLMVYLRQILPTIPSVKSLLFLSTYIRFLNRRIKICYRLIKKYLWLKRNRPYYMDKLHTNACGDFTLLAKKRWIELKGYPELEMHSFHIDSLILFKAYFYGIKQRTLQDPMRIYHIEHSPGSGWTPGIGGKLYYARVRNARIPVLTASTFYSLVSYIEKNLHTYILKYSNWGLKEHRLSETLQ